MTKIASRGPALKRSKDFLDLTLIVEKVWGMGNPRHEVRHLETGFRGEDVSQSAALPVLTVHCQFFNWRPSTVLQNRCNGEE